MFQTLKIIAATTFVSFAGATLALADTAKTETKQVEQKKQQLHKDSNVSNWPHAPERQGGRSYSRIVPIEYGGPVERNFESGRN
ncbi:MAG: hypothetical protein GJ676_10105 [Rhodobacteraceae bacterium]|nr:hypothetical protein [Paracoccaceae bacterium]